VSGVNTFIVSHEGVVYSRDLGPRTPSLAAQIRSFDPVPGWRRESAPAARSGANDRLRVLAGERGCTLCHRAAPAPRETDAAPPLAPSWTEIAARYRGQADAEEKLTRTVIEGADPADRHWKDRLDFVRMGANAPRVTPDEARALVRWVLSTP
jgi:cytochrome c551/c552